MVIMFFKVMVGILAVAIIWTCVYFDNKDHKD